MNRKGNWMKCAIGATAAAAAFVLLDSLVLEKYFFEVKRFTIGPGTGGKRLRLLLLADLHFKQRLLPQHRRLARVVNRLRPDLILIAGDTLDSSGRIGPMEGFFQLLDKNVKKVAIPGNNDYRASPGMDELRAVYRRHNCDLLVNETKAYSIDGTKLSVTGLDDFIEGESDVAAAMENTGREEHHLLLVHSPLQQERAMAGIRRVNQSRASENELNIGYIFAGHNHGGQVRLPGYVPILPPKSGEYVDGWYNDSEPFLYVSRGFGTSSLPLRFWARAEVTLFNYYT